MNIIKTLTNSHIMIIFYMLIILYQPVVSADKDIICEAHPSPELQTGVSHLKVFQKLQIFQIIFSIFERLIFPKIFFHLSEKPTTLQLAHASQHCDVPDERGFGHMYYVCLMFS